MARLGSRVISIDDLRRGCGFATSQGPGAEANNGYGCSHLENSEDGRCHTYACPVAVALYGDEPADAAIAARAWKCSRAQAREELGSEVWMVQAVATDDAASPDGAVGMTRTQVTRTNSRPSTLGDRAAQGGPG